jgi:hypothetical protein
MIIRGYRVYKEIWEKGKWDKVRPAYMVYKMGRLNCVTLSDRRWQHKYCVSYKYCVSCIMKASHRNKGKLSPRKAFPTEAYHLPLCLEKWKSGHAVGHRLWVISHSEITTQERNLETTYPPYTTHLVWCSPGFLWLSGPVAQSCGVCTFLCIRRPSMQLQ